MRHYAMVFQEYEKKSELSRLWGSLGFIREVIGNGKLNY
jgi:hypothetical protein